MNALTRFKRIAIPLIAGCASLQAATIPEPSTVIYGKVLHRAHGHEHRLTEGSLVWTLRDQNGIAHTFTAELEDIRGVFSYRISIPHQALASGLVVDPSVIPLRSSETRYDFLSIEVDGSPAEVLSTADDYLKLVQKSRAATHRIDLQVGFDLADTDGDGMPDWWEKLHGLDWQTADGHLDASGDGWSNLQAYLNGVDPNKDHRIPSLLTSEIAAYGESDNGVWLRAVDADTAPEDLVFTLTTIPAGGAFHYHDNSADGRFIGVGDTFTQADLSAGRLTFLHDDPTVVETSFAVSLSDGDHDPHEAVVAIHIFPPDPGAAVQADLAAAPSWWRDENAVFEAYWGLRENVLAGKFIESALLYFMGKNYGWTLWDQRAETLGVTLQASGPGSHFMLGGAGDDTLIGSDQDDILSGGRGINRLRGGAGRDLFMITHPGLDIIEDFNPQEDVLDLGSLLRGKTGWLNAWIQASYNGSDTTIGVSQTGAGADFTHASIRLEGIELSQDDLNRLWSRGQLLLGAIQGFSAISIEGWPGEPLEEGYSTAELTIRRDGPASQSLTVALSISGSATNGVDYATLPSTITFGAGKRAVSILINPLYDGIAEGTEQINLAIAPGQGYVPGELSSGIIRIIDAKQRFNVVLEDEYAVADDDPGYFRVVRQGPRNGPVELLLSFSGSATRDADYRRISTMLSFADQQASRLIPVEALSLGDLAVPETNRTLILSIRPAFDDEYLLGHSPSAMMVLLSEEESFEQWAAETLPDRDPSHSISSIMEMNSPRTGLNALLEYAFSYGMNLSDGVAPQEREWLNPRLFRDGSGMCFEFSKRLNDPRLEYTIERSADLKNWHSDPVLFEPMELGETMRRAGRVRYRVIEPEGNPLPYMRVRVNLKN